MDVERENYIFIIPIVVSAKENQYRVVLKREKNKKINSKNTFWTCKVCRALTNDHFCNYFTCAEYFITLNEMEDTKRDSTTKAARSSSRNSSVNKNDFTFIMFCLIN